MGEEPALPAGADTLHAPHEPGRAPQLRGSSLRAFAQHRSGGRSESSVAMTAGQPPWLLATRRCGRVTDAACAGHTAAAAAAVAAAVEKPHRRCRSVAGSRENMDAELGRRGDSALS